MFKGGTAVAEMCFEAVSIRLLIRLPSTPSPPIVTENDDLWKRWRPHLVVVVHKHEKNDEPLHAWSNFDGSRWKPAASVLVEASRQRQM
jgi:hypothetical protein